MLHILGERLINYLLIKEVSYKILHRMYPVKHVLERFKLNIDYSCEFCSNEKETIFHLFFHCIYTKIFWVDVENLITRKCYTAVKLGGSDIMIYVDDYGIEKDKAYIIQLLVIMGKFHIHKMKWSASFFLWLYLCFFLICNLVY